MNNIELLKKGRDGDKESFEKFYNQNIGLVISLLKRFDINKNEYEDILQEANYGLLLAMNRFDFSYEVNFSTYAVPIILGEVRKYFRDGGSLKISRGLKQLSSRINSIIDELNYSPSIDELAHILNEKKEAIIEAMSLKTYVESIDNLVNDEGKNIGDNIPYESISLEDLASLQIGLDSLSKKERLIVELHYYCGYSQQEIASRLNMNQVQVSRIESKILEKLKSIV